MPRRSIGTTYRTEARAVPIGGITYDTPGEVNLALTVPAGSVDLEFDIEFLFAKVHDYCISLATQTAAQITSNTFSEAATGTVTLKWNSTSTPAPLMTLDAKHAHAFAPVLVGTANEFTANVTKVYATNAEDFALVVLVAVGLNT